MADMRIPVVFGGKARPDDAVLIDDERIAPDFSFTIRFIPADRPATHAATCICCASATPAAAALRVMFQSRATGAAPWFNRVVVLATPAGIAAVRAAINGDVVIAARFRC